ncbi:MAG TPA: Trm112 family protein [Myxococcales bacterium]|nr:Trm112 family protein [Myxococcales bacterium]
MPIAPELKDILACPKCKGELEFREQEKKIVCRACKLVYRIEGDIPVMLVDEAQPLET